jgi:hypothetical protein
MTRTSRPGGRPQPRRPRWLDLGLRGRAERTVARVLLAVAVATILYGLWLLSMIAFGG